MKLCKKIDDVTNPTTKKFFMKIKATRIDKKVTLLLRKQFSSFIKDLSDSKARILFLLTFEAKNGIRQKK